jgi:hypothetical protein
VEINLKILESLSWVKIRKMWEFLRILILPKILNFNQFSAKSKPIKIHLITTIITKDLTLFKKGFNKELFQGSQIKLLLNKILNRLLAQ